MSLAIFCAASSSQAATAPEAASYLQFQAVRDGVALAQAGAMATLFVDGADHAGVVRAAADLKTDFARVTGRAPKLDTSGVVRGKSLVDVIIVGTLGHSAIVDALVRDKKIDAAAIAGRWEAFLIEAVANPLPGVERALVIVGSDKRGTIYGVYDVSKNIGVSPWYWWADTPVRHQTTIFAKPGRFVETGPVVKYRGIFINDEAPALAGWAKEKFGGLNHDFYAHVFELILRLRGNYLWPAMWGNAFNEDDPENPRLADEYGVVMGTSHHEPMLRAQQEWKRHGQGAWNYGSNDANLRAFWTDGIRRNKAFESIVTIGMRGDGDIPMSEESNVALLEKIVGDQRKILAEQTGGDATKVPQLWALYKEVQTYYEKGMRVPDDVTLLWCDDNWGHLRRLPTTAERKRPGGAGVYYHFDYVGDPRSYKWLNTNPLTKVWEQMHMAVEYGADRIWIVNVGDIKPMELPIEFFLDYAWAPAQLPSERLSEYTRHWAERAFGPEHATDIAEILSTYTQWNGRRKPELLAPDIYSLVNYREAEQVVANWRALAERAERLNSKLPRGARDAFFQLVLYPVKASAIVNDLNFTVGLNRWYAVQGRVSTNALAERARELFRKDADLTRDFNENLAGGKWRHMMDQTHIGYTYWQQPVHNALPAVTELQVSAKADLGVSIEGHVAAWPSDDPTLQPPVLPPMDAYTQTSRTVEVFSRGKAKATFTAGADVPWLRVRPSHGEVATEVRLTVQADWGEVPVGQHEARITIRGSGDRTVVVTVPVSRPASPSRADLAAFVETDRAIAIEAEHWTRAVDGGEIHWQVLPDFGRTLSGVTTFPVTASSQMPSANSPRLEYRVYLFSKGDLTIDAYLAPTLDFQPGRGLRFALSFDDTAPQIVDMVKTRSKTDWETQVANAVRKMTVRLSVGQSGYHTLKFWRVDPGVVLERLVIDAGGVRPSYFGPPESYRGARPHNP
jgi:hypothetical protein